MFPSKSLSVGLTVGLIALCFILAGAARAAVPLGVFEDQSAVGKPALAGAAALDAATQTYRVTGGGKNIWAKADDFHYVWKKVSGDVALGAEVSFPGPVKLVHRKACLMIRQSLATDAPYADAALHGDGLTSFQYRDAAGGETFEIQSTLKNPAWIGIEKRGDTIFMLVGEAGKAPRHAGGSIKIKLQEPFYVGLAVCSHDDKIVETAEFAKVKLTNEPFKLAAKPAVESTLETIELAKLTRRVVYSAPGRFEAPNWTRDGKEFVFNAKGHLWRLPVTGGEPVQIDTGSATECNNDHGISFDGTQLAISSRKGNKSIVFTLPLAGGEPRQVTPLGHSYWHGWSPDGQTLAFCGERGGEYDVYTIPAAGGQEKRLTTAPGLDDGPEYSPDGKVIYFNSLRSGTMQIWRMAPDGSGQEQVTKDEYNNWFAHVSPNGKWIAFVSFDKSIDPKVHPADKDVLLRVMPVAGGEIKTLAKVFGGQGTINVNSWSPDSKSLAFVSYLWVNP